MPSGKTASAIRAPSSVIVAAVLVARRATKSGTGPRSRDPVTLRLWVSYTPTGGVYRTQGFYGLHLPKYTHRTRSATATELVRAMSVVDRPRAV